MPFPFCGSTATMDVRCIESPNWWSATALCDGIWDHECSCQMIAQGRTKDEAVKNLVKGRNRRA